MILVKFGRSVLLANARTTRSEAKICCRTRTEAFWELLLLSAVDRAGTYTLGGKYHWNGKGGDCTVHPGVCRSIAI
ncbi:hypothetical protein QUB68_01945 [Microcoleus sp. A006_D1]